MENKMVQRAGGYKWQKFGTTNKMVHRAGWYKGQKIDTVE